MLNDFITVAETLRCFLKLEKIMIDFDLFARQHALCVALQPTLFDSQPTQQMENSITSVSHASMDLIRNI